MYMDTSKYKFKDTKSLLSDGWSFATVNGRFAEIYFAKGFGIWGHAYVNKFSFKTKKEKEHIKKDLKKYKFTYRNRFYFDQLNKLKIKVPDRKKIFPKSKNYKKFSTAEEFCKSLSL